MAPNEDETGENGTPRKLDETEMPIGEVQDPETRDSTLWRCSECGEIDRFSESLPVECSGCGAPREELHYVSEF